MTPPGRALDEAVSEVEEAVAGLVAVDLEGSDEPAIRDAVARLHLQTRKIEARITASAQQLAKRQAQRISPDDPDDLRASQQAEQDTQRELADTLHITHPKPKTRSRPARASTDFRRRRTERSRPGSGTRVPPHRGRSCPTAGGPCKPPRTQALLCWTCHKLADRLHLQGRLRHNTVTWWQHHPDDTWTPYHRWRRRTPHPDYPPQGAPKHALLER